MPVDLLLLDACVLIDFLAANRDLITVASAEVRIHVASVVLEEVDDIDAATLRALGVVIVEPELELSMDAARRRGGLSFEDWVSLLLARTHGWTCVTNDRRLRKECGAHEVAVLWGLEILLLLVRRARLSPDEAIAAAVAMHAANPRGIPAAVVEAFRTRIRTRED